MPSPINDSLWLLFRLMATSSRHDHISTWPDRQPHVWFESLDLFSPRPALVSSSSVGFRLSRHSSNFITSSDLVSMSYIHSIVRVHFATVLASPSHDRPRRAGLVYPKVAQSKGSSDRSTSKDLRWEWSSTLSSSSAIARRSSVMERLSMKSSMIIRSTYTTTVVVDSFNDVAFMEFTSPKSKPTTQGMLLMCRSILVTPFCARQSYHSSLTSLHTHTSVSSIGSEGSLKTVSG
ncbi:hypothetical protein PILCRDRAFT_233359 [Piloderma croceum F 1598]|uniref:Uncharacterized protein n=1 Tax=Piloderma croceum (strain F 1598) TaxID=765440 RepID=A0A0C3GA88_PILCF|nr:hypothetical protein PILCRDRAFT_233359 [Piloderma croceum F 1598]